MEEDPAYQFFPEGEVDLYGVLDVPRDASDETIRKAYRRRALRLHPDKLGGKGTEEQLLQFHRLGFAYAVLSSPKRRKRYDDTGKTDEPLFEEEGFSWDTYFRDTFDDVCGQKIEEFKKQYVGSEEEREDVYDAYRSTDGSLEEILNTVPCANVIADEERFVALIEDGIRAQELERLAGWTSSLKDTKGREKMRRNARKEAAEAEEHAKELGIWDEVFGDGKKRPRKKASAPEEGSSKPSKRSRSTKTDAKAEEDEDLGGLAAMIQQRQASRGGGIGSLIARLEADAHAEADERHKARGGKGKRERRDPLAPRLEAGEPSEEEFLAAQQRLLNKGKGSAGGSAADKTTKGKGKKSR